MKKFFLTVLMLAALLPAYSQIGLRIEMNRKVYMLYEPIYACISLRNNSGRPLVFGQNPKLQGFIYFLIQDSKGRTVAKRPGTEISATGLVLKPGESRNLVLPVNEYYELEKTGSYTIFAMYSLSSTDGVMIQTTDDLLEKMSVSYKSGDEIITNPLIR